MGTKCIEESCLSYEQTIYKKDKRKQVFNKIVDGVTNIIKSGEYRKFLECSNDLYSYIHSKIIQIKNKQKDK